MRRRRRKNENRIVLLVYLTVTIPIRIIIEKIDIKPYKINNTPIYIYINIFRRAKQQQQQQQLECVFSFLWCAWTHSANNTNFVYFVVYLLPKLYLYSFWTHQSPSFIYWIKTMKNEEKKIWLITPREKKVC